jgi:hypothetical protein
VPVSVAGWVVLGIVVWIVLSALLGLLVGKIIRNRDRQVPDDVPTAAADPEDRGPSARSRRTPPAE